MPLPIGSYVGRIRIDALLGAGGMGEVYRGWDEKLERAVALKSITSERRLSPVLRARFLREARVLSKLDHPNICRIWDVLELVDGDWLVLELIDGPTLRERIEKGLSRQEAVEIVLAIARVLAVAHGRGIIHRDLKPENVMQTSTGDVKVLDFGLARAVEAEYADPALVEEAAIDLEKTLIIGMESTSPDDSRTSVGSLVGTLQYMSPEQARGLPLTPASDVYSLGVMLHEMLLGEPAYGPVESVAELLQKVRSAQLLPLALRDAKLQRLVSRMASLQPSERPSVGEVIEVLDRIAARPVRRKRLAWRLASAAALIVVAGAAIFIASRLQRRSQLLGSKGGTRLVILPFQNASGNPGLKWVELGLMDHVMRGLRNVGGLDVVPQDAVLKSHIRFDDAADRKRLLEATGADAMIRSTVNYHDGTYVISYVVADARRSEPSREVSSAILTEAANKMAEQIAKRIDPRHHLHRVSRGTGDTFAALAFDIGREIEILRGEKYAEKYYAVALDRDPAFLDAKQALAAGYARSGRFAEAFSMLDEVIAEARRRRELDTLVIALVNSGFWRGVRGESDLADQHTREALDISYQLGRTQLEVYALNARGVVLRSMNRLDESEAIELKALQLARDKRIPYVQIAALNNLGANAMRRNNSQAARKWFEESLRLSKEFGFRDTTGIVMGNLAQIYGNLGELSRAEEMSNEAASLAHELGDRETEAEAVVAQAIWAYARRDEDRAIALLEQALSEARSFGAAKLEELILSDLAQARTRRGELDTATSEAAAALAIDRRIQVPEMGPDVYAGAAYPAIRAGRLDDAQRLLDQADAMRPAPRTAIIRSRLLYARHRYAEALSLIEKAKRSGDLWLPQYESMRQAFAESARTNKESSIVFEEPVKSHAPAGDHRFTRDISG